MRDCKLGRFCVLINYCIKGCTQDLQIRKWWRAREEDDVDDAPLDSIVLMKDDDHHALSLDPYNIFAKNNHKASNHQLKHT